MYGIPASTLRSRARRFGIAPPSKAITNKEVVVDGNTYAKRVQRWKRALQRAKKKYNQYEPEMGLVVDPRSIAATEAAWNAMSETERSAVLRQWAQDRRREKSFFEEVEKAAAILAEERMLSRKQYLDNAKENGWLLTALHILQEYRDCLDELDWLRGNDSTVEEGDHR
jgi:hypothetical protein